MALALILVVLALASVLFYFVSPWHLTPLASNWGSMDGTIAITLVVTGVVFVGVNGFLAYAIFRYRYASHKRAHYEPENKRLEGWLTAATTLGIAALLAPGLFVWNAFVTVPDDARNVEIVGEQWSWSFRFPGEDGRFGAVHTRFVSGSNPFGIDPSDPAGEDDVLVQDPRVLLPVDEPVRGLLRSKDVIHNFQVAQFRAKMDMVPGQVSYLWFTPTRTGEFEILCAELCGIAHFAMRGLVEVVERERFQEWLAAQPTFGEIRARDPGEPSVGKGLFNACASCHGPEGQGQRATNAPKLGGQDAWYVIRQLENFREGARGTDADNPPGQQMRPFARQLADRAAMADVAAYIESLPDRPVEETVSGDAGRGESIYRSTCASCHGAKGQGVRARNAPRLAGMSDWYLVHQLENFKAGIRGDGHPQDLYGTQMAELAKTLIDEAAVRDVVAYINTLPRAAETAGEAEELARRTD